jgi:hypothetical protein
MSWWRKVLGLDRPTHQVHREPLTSREPLEEMQRILSERKRSLERKLPEADRQGEYLRRAREVNHLAERIRIALEGSHGAPPAS